MTPRCWGGIIRVHWLECAALLAACILAAAGQDVSKLARAYAGEPDLANRTALLNFAALHPDTNGGIAWLALGAHDAASDRKGDASRELKAAAERLPKIADYIAFLAASASFDAHDFDAAGRSAEAVLNHQPKSPLNGQAALVAAKAYSSAGTPARAAEVLRRAYADLPQPDGDAALAGALDALHDIAGAVAYDQRVWLEYPLSTQAQGAEAELNRLRTALGASYHPPPAGALFRRANKLLDGRDYARARREFTDLAAATSGTEHDLALVRIGVADQRARKDAAALAYLQSLQVASPEADAERLYSILAAARRLNRLDVMEQALDQLARNHANSDWRLRALVAAGDEYFFLNQPQDLERVFQACYEQFPKSAQAPACHWRVAFSAYVQNRKDAVDLLKAHVRRYPDSDPASGALYYLGRDAERMGNGTEAVAWYQQLQRSFPNYYYASLGRARLADPQLNKAAPSPAVVAFLRGIPFPGRPLPGSFDPLPAAQLRFDRARLLRSAALDELAETELRFGAAAGEQPGAFGLELARTASAAAAPNRAIRYLKRYAPGYVLSPLDSAPREFWELAFPLPWREPLFEYSQQSGLDPFLVAALIRQESEFDPRVISHANAYGLTQVLPSTGREISRGLGIRGFHASMLLEPETNLKLGTRYLKSLLDAFDGQWEPTLAAYNAGKSRAVAWKARVQYREPAEYVESIPFSETRTYVQIVLRNADLYRRFYNPK